MGTKQLFNESMLRARIAAGGSDGWQLLVGKYRVVFFCDEKFRKGFFARLQCPVQRLIAVVYDTHLNPSQALLQISVPAKAASVNVKNNSRVQVWGIDGRLCAFEIASSGCRFIGGKWAHISNKQKPSIAEVHRGLTADTERWHSVKH